MPANKYALLRYRIIDRCLSNRQRPYPSLADLREACETELYGEGGENISESAIQKDLYAMRHELNLGYHAPIAYSVKHRGYYYSDEDYTLESIPLSEEEASAIRLAANTLSQFKGIDLFRSSEAAIDKIMERLKLGQGEKRQDAVDAVVQFETAPSFRGGEYLSAIFNAIDRREVLHFEYAKFTGGKGRPYSLHPYLLKEYRNRWYVIGYNPDKGAVVVFGLDRIKGELRSSGEQFERLRGFRPDLYFRDSLGITVVDEDPVEVQLRFSPLSGKYVLSQPWHHSQRSLRDDEVALEVELKLCITRELIMQILSYGKDVEVIGPESLRQSVAKELDNARQKYR